MVILLANHLWLCQERQLEYADARDQLIPTSWSEQIRLHPTNSGVALTVQWHNKVLIWGTKTRTCQTPTDPQAQTFIICTIDSITIHYLRSRYPDEQHPLK